MKKTLIYTALLLTIVAQSAWAGGYDLKENYTPTTLATKPTEGPWTFDSVSNDAKNYYEDDVDPMRFNELGKHSWWKHTDGNDSEIAYQLQDGDGLAFVMYCHSAYRSHFGVFSTYKHEEKIPAYTRIKLTWEFQLRARTTYYSQAVVLYARDNMDALKNTQVTFREEYAGRECADGQQYYIAHLETNNSSHQDKTDKTKTLTHDFYFDNSTGDTEQSKSWNLMLTLVAANYTDEEAWATSDCKQWGSFKNISYSWSDTCYFKYITFDANGGEGEMGAQTIENSGNLTANAFTREYYTFAGWATTPDGDAVYTDGGEITATLGSKGPATLYAVWVSSPVSVMTLINAIPNPLVYTEACNNAILAARAAYNTLSDEDKASVSNYAALTNAEATYSVVALIAAIGEVENTPESKAAIDAARTAYNALNTDRKALVGNYSTLTYAELTYAVLDAKGKIAAIGTVTAESKEAIDAARAAFEALTDAEEAKISAIDLETLQAAEAAYAVLNGASTITFVNKDAEPVRSQVKALNYPDTSGMEGFDHWETEEKNVSADKTIVIKAVYE